MMTQTAHQLTTRIAPLASVDELRERLHYDPEMGVLTWRVAKGARTRAGHPVGWANNQGYLKFKLRSDAYYVHRAVWAWVHGSWPDQLVDHKNGDVTDNRIANLRLATNRENTQNGKVRRVGLKGATWNKAEASWAAQIRWRGKNMHLGLFGSEQAAHDAYCDAAVKLYGAFARFE